MISPNEKTEKLNRKQPPPVADAVHFDLHLKPYQKYFLDNGVPVYAVDAGAEEVMMLEWVFFAGNSLENKNLLAATTNFLLRNGTSTKTAFQINEHFEYHGAYLNRACYNETATVTLHTLSKHIRELLPVVREILTDSVLPAEELAVYQQNMLQRLKVNLKKNDFVAGRLIDAYLYGEQHPYGKYTHEEDFEKLNREELVDFYDRYYRHGKWVIFAAGKLPSDLAALLNKNFGDLDCQGIEIPEHSSTPSLQKKYRITNDENGVQGAIRMARHFPNRHHPDFTKAQVLNVVLGGYFGSRLMSNIREEKGYTYGIHSYLQNHIEQSAWMISTEAGKDVSEAAIEEVYKEMKILREEPVSEDELMLVRNYMMGSILGDLDGPFQIMARWKNIILNNLSEQYFYETINTIRNITADELQLLAQKYLQPDEFYELVVI
ncbi:MAG TPA: pitrilysin family protein [Chitinophagaceae bacterium]|nr:insulinase family protein [Chitinophagaceae bacterium]MCB9054917.1 insulinase family protein [Chitinophagales bacterium]HPG10606.1 pitrilysin family protein [Chitinophagaceae bacterium]